MSATKVESFGNPQKYSLDLEPDLELIGIDDEADTISDINLESLIRESDHLPMYKGNVDGLRLYLREIGQHSLLTASEEVRLFTRRDNTRAEIDRLEEMLLQYNLNGEYEQVAASLVKAQKLVKELNHTAITRNLRLAASIALKKYYSSNLKHLRPNDLISFANRGLIRGVDRFDTAKGFRFSTYATWWIKQAVLRGIADEEIEKYQRQFEDLRRRRGSRVSTIARK